MEQTRSSAPVSAFAEIDIAAPDREVWTVIADIASWPTWNPAVRHAVFDAELEVGAGFRFSTEIGTLKCRITEVDAPRTLSWKGRVLVFGERQTWNLASGSAGTRVAVRAEMTGLAVRLVRRRMQERLQGVLDALVQLLKLEAETRATEEREEAERLAELARREDAHE